MKLLLTYFAPTIIYFLGIVLINIMSNRRVKDLIEMQQMSEELLIDRFRVLQETKNQQINSQQKMIETLGNIISKYQREKTVLEQIEESV